MRIKVARTVGTDQSIWHHYSERSVATSEPCRFSLGSTGADGAANKRLVQITSLRDRLACKLGQGFGLTLTESLTLLIVPVQFQQATMGSLLKYYREKIHRQRSIIEQFKKERAELIALRRCG